MKSLMSVVGITTISDDSTINYDIDWEDLSDGELDDIQDDDTINGDDDDDDADDDDENDTNSLTASVNLEKSKESLKIDPELCMLDKIKAIEKNLEDFEEKLSQYEHDINSIELAVGPVRIREKSLLGMDSDSDSANKWIDNGQGLLPFIRTCLQDSRLKHIVQWVEEDLEFEIVDLGKLAELWGKEKKKEGMTKRKINRSLSYLIKQKGKLIRSTVNRAAYKIVTSNKSFKCDTRRRDSTSSNESEISNTNTKIAKPNTHANKLKELLEASRKKHDENTNGEMVGLFSNTEKLRPNTLRNTNNEQTENGRIRKRGYESTPASPMSTRSQLIAATLSRSLPSDLSCLPMASSDLSPLAMEPVTKMARTDSFMPLLTHDNNKNTMQRLHSSWPDFESMLSRTEINNNTNESFPIFSISSNNNQSNSLLGTSPLITDNSGSHINPPVMNMSMMSPCSLGNINASAMNQQFSESLNGSPIMHQISSTITGNSIPIQSPFNMDYSPNPSCSNIPCKSRDQLLQSTNLNIWPENTNMKENNTSQNHINNSSLFLMNSNVSFSSINPDNFPITTNVDKTEKNINNLFSDIDYVDDIILDNYLNGMK